MHSLLSARGLSFELPNGRELFKNLNFSLNNEISALIGPNGIGKSSLAQLLAGLLEPSAGVVTRQRRVTFFSQRQLAPEISVHEFLMTHETWSLWREQLLEGIHRESFCSSLSGGEWMRVRLANTLNDQFLILDEPTNDLDQEGRQFLIEFLKNRNEGTLLISHDRSCLQLCSHFLELSNHGLTELSGTWQDYTQFKNKERSRLKKALEVATNEREAILTKRSSLKERQEKRNLRGAKKALRGGMPKILIGARQRQAQATTGKIDDQTFAQAQTAIQQAVTAFKDIKVDPIMYVDLVGHTVANQKLVAEAKNFNVCFQKWIYQNDLNFSWRGPIRIAIQGKNGSGKSTLIRAILGDEFNKRGSVQRGNLKTIYIDQQCSMLDEQKTILENVCQFATADKETVRNKLAQFLFMKDSVFQTVASLSGGERMRVALACAFLSHEKPELLILDEPTNNLDLPNVEFLENLICQFCGALLIVSHDEIFLKNCNIDEVFQI